MRERDQLENRLNLAGTHRKASRQPDTYTSRIFGNKDDGHEPRPKVQLATGSKRRDAMQAATANSNLDGMLLQNSCIPSYSLPTLDATLGHMNAFIADDGLVHTIPGRTPGNELKPQILKSGIGEPNF